MFPLDIRPVGDAAVVARLGDKIEPETLHRAWALTRAVRAALKDAALDVVPAYSSVFVRFDPLSTGLAEIIAGVRGAAENFELVRGNGHGRRKVDRSKVVKHFEVGVCFHDDFGPDLEESAALLGLSSRKLIDKFCSTKFEVAFLGFVAGFPYLTGLPLELALPRLATPRKSVPRGSVAIAERQCGIYPRQVPGGWRLLGRTAAALFDLHRDPATLFAPGDTIRFTAERHIDRATARIVGKTRIARKA